MVATAAQGIALNKNEAIAYVGANANRFGVDPAAMLAVASFEGLNRPPINGVGQTWYLPNEGGSFNFGPPSYNSGWAGHPAAGTPIVQAHGSDAATWAWTPAGLDYWMEQIAHAAGGLRGDQAIAAIVHNFERPREDLASGEITNASRVYKSFQDQIQNPLPGTTTPPPINPHPLPGVPGGAITPPGQLPITSDPQTGGQGSTSNVPFAVKLFDTPIGPIYFELPWDPSGVLLFLAAIFAIIIGALVWDKSRNVIVKGTETAAVAAAA